MSDEATTRRVTPAELEENFALRDEIKQLRILIAAIIRDNGGRLAVSDVSMHSISAGDTFTTENLAGNRYTILTFKGKT